MSVDAGNYLKEPLIKSIMNRVADKNGVLAATRYCAAADCGSGEVASSPHLRFAYSEPMPTARRATPVVVILAPTIRCGEAVWCESGGSGLSRTKGLRPTVSRPLCQGAQHRERPFLLQPARALALRAVCYVRLLAKGITIRVSPLLNPLPRAGEEAIVLSPACGGKLERGLALLASHPSKPDSRPCGT